MTKRRTSWQWTIHEVAALVPGTPVIALTETQLWAMRERSDRGHSLWQILYDDLSETYHYAKSDLHNLTYVGSRLMARLLQLEKARLRMHHHLYGPELERACSWSNMGSGPLEVLMDWPIAGNGLCVLAQTEEREQAALKAWEQKIDAGNAHIVHRAKGATFIDWMLDLEGYIGGIGDLADDIRSDPDFPRTDTFQVVLRYLIGHQACDAAIDCLYEAWMTYHGAPVHKDRPVALTQRFRILKRDGYRCTLCGRTPAAHGVVLEVDHILARAHGGTSNDENLATLCFDCNRGKRTSSL